jgi:hypothetical protein
VVAFIVAALLPSIAALPEPSPKAIWRGLSHPGPVAALLLLGAFFVGQHVHDHPSGPNGRLWPNPLEIGSPETTAKVDTMIENGGLARTLLVTNDPALALRWVHRTRVAFVGQVPGYQDAPPTLGQMVAAGRSLGRTPLLVLRQGVDAFAPESFLPGCPPEATEAACSDESRQWVRTFSGDGVEAFRP